MGPEEIKYYERTIKEITAKLEIKKANHTLLEIEIQKLEDILKGWKDELEKQKQSE